MTPATSGSRAHVPGAERALIGVLALQGDFADIDRARTVHRIVDTDDRVGVVFFRRFDQAFIHFLERRIKR